jgi:hypothetical protein
MRFITVFTTALACATAVFGAATPNAACQSSASPAYDVTRQAFEGMKSARLYMLGAIINADPTHAELQEAAKWQLGQVRELMTKAYDANAKDSSFARREWFKIKLGWLKFEVSVAEGILAVGLPSLPWLGKLYEWSKKMLDDLKSAWKKFWSIFHLEQGNEGLPEDIWNYFFDGDAEPENATEEVQGKAMADDFTNSVKGLDAKLAELKSTDVCKAQAAVSA